MVDAFAILAVTRLYSFLKHAERKRILLECREVIKHFKFSVKLLE